MTRQNKFDREQVIYVTKTMHEYAPRYPNSIHIPDSGTNRTLCGVKIKSRLWYISEMHEPTCKKCLSERTKSDD